VRAEILEDQKFLRIFNALEGVGDDLMPYVCLPAVRMMDAQGLHTLLSILEKHQFLTKRRIWNWHEVHFDLELGKLWLWWIKGSVSSRRLLFHDIL
jgi:hypothetical protein